MTRVDESRAECRVLTFKEGLLSAVAHDLLLRVGRFAIEYDEAGGTVEARFDARSLTVVCAMKDGHEAPAALPPKDKAEIARTIQKDVLDSARFPEIRFTGSIASTGAGGHRVRGTLALRGQSRPIEVAALDSTDRYAIECVIHQPDYSIKPYSAMLGTLKIKPDVRVQLTLPRG